MRTQSKIALILCVSSITMLLLFSGIIYYSLYQYSYSDFYKRLETRANIAATYNFETDKLTANALKALRIQYLEKLPQEKEYVIPVKNTEDLKAGASQYELPLVFLNKIWSRGRQNLKSGETFYSGTKVITANVSAIVVVSADNYYGSHHLTFLRNNLLGGIAFVILLTSLFYIYFSKNVFEPIRKITSKVKEINTENIHLRLTEHADENNEISELTSTFNEMLTRIETAFETQKNFISNASHEFGTPLTAIIGEADVALIKDRSTEEYKEALSGILKQAERLEQITKSLFFLAQTGYEGKKITFEIFRTDEIIWEVKTIMDSLYPQNKIFVDLDLLPEDPKKLKVKGNKQLLHLAFGNIISNACKYSHNKPVWVSIAASNKQIIVIIKDNGIGIPENELQYIYDPFFRASNTHYFEGYGIGLPLARNIIRLHKGTLQVSSIANEGTTVQVNIPQFEIVN